METSSGETTIFAPHPHIPNRFIVIAEVDHEGYAGTAEDVQFICETHNTDVEKLIAAVKLAESAMKQVISTGLQGEAAVILSSTLDRLRTGMFDMTTCLDGTS